MISGVLFINTNGDTVLTKFYRDDVTIKTAETFRLEVIAAGVHDAPVKFFHTDKCSFLYIRHGDVYVVAITRQNCNATMVFQFLYSLVDLFRAYFGGKFSEASIKNNFVLVYELLDEIMDNGWPQITTPEILKEFITVGDVKVNIDKLQKKQGRSITREITGSCDWRTPGKYKYRKNEVFLDVLESVNLLLSSQGQQILRAEVQGKIQVRSFLSGMPECKFGLNDKILLKNVDPERRKKVRQANWVTLDDTSFHRCVRLHNFDEDRTISFIPPDGEFDLMKYRITQGIRIPFEVMPQVVERGRNRVEYEIKIKGAFSQKLFASNVHISIPVPGNTEKAMIKATYGKAKYDPANSIVMWKIKKFAGGASYTLRGEVKLSHRIKEKVWSRPPITMDFQVPMYTSSGVHVRFLKVFEKSGYKVDKWVRYITKAGNYQIRI